jgi:preprotein translocase subunit Sec63
LFLRFEIIIKKKNKIEIMKTQLLTAIYLLALQVINVYCKNYYDILGVSKTDTTPQIKKAFRNLALKYHPGFNINLF